MTGRCVDVRVHLRHTFARGKLRTCLGSNNFGSLGPLAYTLVLLGLVFSSFIRCLALTLGHKVDIPYAQGSPGSSSLRVLLYWTRHSQPTLVNLCLLALGLGAFRAVLGNKRQPSSSQNAWDINI